MVGRLLVLTLALALLATGGLGLALTYAGEQDAVRSARDAALSLAEAAAGALPVEAEPETWLAAVAGFPLRFVLAPAGLVLLVAALLPGRRKPAAEDAEEEGAPAEKVDKRSLKKSRKDAASIARKGMPNEAAELCFAVGLLDEAAQYFIEAGELVRAAEIRHDQNRFLEAAELYAKAGHHDAAGVIYGQQEEWQKAADAYVEAENLSVAGEMFEKAGNHRKAAQCYERSDFPRHAAKAYIQCELWEDGARCLEAVMREEGPGAANDAARQNEYRKLVRMAGNLFERAGQLDRAQAVLERGGLYAPAAEIAVKLGAHDQAADLFLKAKDAPRAAKSFEALGEHERAARILAEHHRDKGDSEQAAEQFETAGELLEAGDLYRLLERFDRAASCYERFGAHAQAAEMWIQAGERERAAQCFERGEQFAEAAECFALSGEEAREAEMLEKAGEHLRAGRIHREHGRDDEAISALQQVEAGHADFAAASALLGEIFREREMNAVAIAKLTDAVDGRELDRDTVRAFYCLATVYEAEGDAARAIDLYEKILAFDYHYDDVDARLAALRERAAKDAEAAAQRAEAAAGAPAGQPGRYKIRGTLGRGGMGIVYEAEDTVLDRQVALKVLPESLKENPQALKNFLREAKSAAQLNHPNIVTVYDAGEQDGVYYIAMEYVDGNTLKEIIKRRGSISPRGIVHVVSQMAEALAYAHEKKIVHRDIKTANAMWTKDRKAKIMDFGLAKVIEEVRNHTTVVSGTPYYMSPEQTLGKNVDHRTDIYSLGVSIFEMATGSLPFTEGNLPYHHVHTAPPDPRELCPELPDLLARMIDRCLKKDPAERYQSAREILAELKGGL